LRVGTVPAPEQAFVVATTILWLERVTAPAPMAVVVTRTVAEIEVAVGLALIARFTSDSRH